MDGAADVLPPLCHRNAYEGIPYSRSMITKAPGLSLLEELEAQQDEVLEELERLDRRIEKVIAECAVWRGENDAPVKMAAAA